MRVQRDREASLAASLFLSLLVSSFPLLSVVPLFTGGLGALPWLDVIGRTTRLPPSSAVVGAAFQSDMAPRRAGKRDRRVCCRRGALGTRSWWGDVPADAQARRVRTSAPPAARHTTHVCTRHLQHQLTTNSSSSVAQRRGLFSAALTDAFAQLPVSSLMGVFRQTWKTELNTLRTVTTGPINAVRVGGNSLCKSVVGSAGGSRRRRASWFAIASLASLASLASPASRAPRADVRNPRSACQGGGAVLYFLPCK